MKIRKSFLFFDKKGEKKGDKTGGIFKKQKPVPLSYQQGAEMDRHQFLYQGCIRTIL